MLKSVYSHPPAANNDTPNLVMRRFPRTLFTGNESTFLEFSMLLEGIKQNQQEPKEPIIYSKLYRRASAHPVAFLDFDGVIAPLIPDYQKSKFERLKQILDIDKLLLSYSEMLAARFGTTPDEFLRIAAFSGPNIKRIQQLCFSHNARIVISSNWRIGRSLQQLINILDLWGLGVFVIGTTSQNQALSRSAQITEWISKNRHLISKVLIIDDQNKRPLSRNFPNKFVKTDEVKGFDLYAYLEANQIFENQSVDLQPPQKLSLKNKARNKLVCSA